MAFIGQLASDANNPQFVGASNPDDVLSVTFYMRSERNNFESEKQGRPIFYEVPYVIIQAPGNQLSIIDTEARDDHKVRFPRQWAVFQNSQLPPEAQQTGTPLEHWPALSRAQAEEYKGRKFFTVEQIANASDLQIQSLGMNAQSLRQKARAFLAVAKDTALAQAQAAEIQKLRDEAQARDTAHAAEIADLRKLIADERPKRKYTRKPPKEA